MGLVTLDTYFLDGTKMEANANRLAFALAKSTRRYREQLRAKVHAHLAAIVFYTLRVPLVGLFTIDAAVKPLAYARIARATCFQWVNAVNEIFSGSMRGYKLSTIPAAISIVGICGTRILWVHTGFAALPTYEHLVLAYPLSWAVTASAQAVAYLVVLRRRNAANVA